jgi:two-component system phosphate regulon sensor histidine kinase PhoR
VLAKGLHVRDDGPGFDVTSHGEPFRRFARGASVRAGTGLGLALCQEIVRKHGGTIDIESALDRGTTVSIMLPASA